MPEGGAGQTYCPYKVIALTTALPSAGRNQKTPWTYETPYEAVAGIREYLAFHPARVDAIEVLP